MTGLDQKVFHNSKVVRKSQEEHDGKEVWRVELDKSVFGGQYDTIITRVEPEIASRLEPGRQYNLILYRQKLRKADYDGGRDWMYYWGMAGIADGGTAQPTETTTNGAAQRQTTPAPTPASWGSLDERIAWNSAINNAASYVGPMNDGLPPPLPPLEYWVAEVDRVAQSIFALIRRGPTPPAEDAPPPEQQGDPEPPREPTAEDARHLKEILDAQEPTVEGVV